MNHKENAKKLFLEGVASVTPENICFDVSDIPEDKEIVLLGSGKAALEMAKALQKQLGRSIKRSFIVSNYADEAEGLEIFVSTHPTPSQKSLEACERMIHEFKQLERNDFMIYLLSGGSSALIEKPIAPISLEEFQGVNQLLLMKSVPITEINIVRKHLSWVKGGKLGALCGTLGIVYVISDVIGDDLQVIGSAPLYKDDTTCADAKAVLEKYNIWDCAPRSVQNVINLCHHENPKRENPKIKHQLVASNIQCLRTMAQKAISMGYDAHIVTDRLRGDVQKVAEKIVREVHSVQSDKPMCLLFGGESTVEIKGKGKGGRNQELALWVLKLLKDDENITFLSAGTDGIDGQSIAAGAVVDQSDYREDIDEFLRNNDSYYYHKRGGSLMVTGETGTNVMDVMMAIKE